MSQDLAPKALASPDHDRQTEARSGAAEPALVVLRTPSVAKDASSLAQTPLTSASRDAGTDDVDPLDAAASLIDHAVHGLMARVTNGLSPMALGKAFSDWGVHLALSPGKQMQLVGKAIRKSVRFGLVASTSFPTRCSSLGIDPLPQDRRFAAEDWNVWPYNLLSQGFLLQQQWWHNATTGIAGVKKQHEEVVAFTIRQLLDMLSPSNFILTNPVVLRRTAESGGANLINGFANFLEDWARREAHAEPAGAEAFVPGRNVAVTSGKVVYRNRLIELIQYAPQTEKVHAEPILFVPAWIMKYYILDLSPENSLVRYLVAQGFTVFMISWRNPDASDRDLSMEDYRRLGVMSAIEQVKAILPGRKIQGVGYCLGGTLLSIAAATMAREGDETLKSLSLFAAQLDFTEAGELTLFINESQVSFLEDLMRSEGFLPGGQMAGAFQLLRSKDLIWSKIVHDYLMGERQPLTDLMAWNADATRLPYRMHSEYLRRLFLDNDLAEGRFETDGRPVALTDIRAPIFAVGTETDHVAPWRSAFKIHLLTDTDVTFLLTSGGHNVGVVSEPGHKRRHYRLHHKNEHDRYLDPDSWFQQAEQHEGSWWPEWAHWLSARSTREQDPPHLDSQSALPDAPGTYVFQT
ncbi:PHA/PHB synthase family protein [Methylocapsa acidiphila]|uniref:PHA/PHB synthase family protein n=1 Tax=Methylocapsa acidiphila TaxID=133552 RepID=UPI000403567E|nr:alpha/beta fold hydrolase [Methylocapsa acidiphila]